MTHTGEPIDGAREKRRLRAEALRSLETGQTSIRNALRATPDALGTCPVFIVLKHAPHLGAGGAEQVCKTAWVWPLTPLGQLTKRERYGIVKALPRRVR